MPKTGDKAVNKNIMVLDLKEFVVWGIQNGNLHFS